MSDAHAHLPFLEPDTVARESAVWPQRFEKPRNSSGGSDTRKFDESERSVQVIRAIADHRVSVDTIAGSDGVFVVSDHWGGAEIT